MDLRKESAWDLAMGYRLLHGGLDGKKICPTDGTSYWVTRSIYI